MNKYVVAAGTKKSTKPRAKNALAQGKTARRASAEIPLTLVARHGFSAFLAAQTKPVRTWLESTGFRALAGQVCTQPDKDWGIKQAFVAADLSTAFGASRLPSCLPKGKYQVTSPLTPAEADRLVLAWLLGTYEFCHYKKSKSSFATLVAPPEANLRKMRILADAIAFGRDLITTPAEDMAPPHLAAAMAALATESGAEFTEIVGDALLSKNYPCIHAVGRASVHAPRLLDLRWGDTSHPKVTLVGKGVTFDSGGLDLKPARSMKLMKKDMGGAATVLGIAQAVMKLGLPVRLRVLIPAVENSVSSNAFRPLDVLRSRKGLSVEVGDTDAEGRLVLCDALAEADTEAPDLLLDIATLTGAARVALGTSLPALFSSSDSLAEELLVAGVQQDDPLWRLPLHRPYRRSLDSRVADISNIGGAGYGGAITAALFLQEFVSAKTPWLHIDSMAYNLESQPGRPMGGETFALRAVVAMLEQRYLGAP